jgi:hypothetical protein
MGFSKDEQVLGECLLMAPFRPAIGFRKIRTHMATRMRITDAMTPRPRACVESWRYCKDEHEVEEQFYEGDLCYH